MSSIELIMLLQRGDQAAKRQLFDSYYGKLAAIAQRYAKDQAQAEEMLNIGLSSCMYKLERHRHIQDLNLDAYMKTEFITDCIAFIKSIRSEYYVSSTVNASRETSAKNYNLFETHDLVDFHHIDNAVLIKSLQQMVPSQRLIFNLHVVDGFSLPEASAMLESSEETVKSNLEKARFNLQKNIEASVKNIKV